jgi:hypothetical protein
MTEDLNTFFGTLSDVDDALTAFHRRAMSGDD